MQEEIKKDKKIFIVIPAYNEEKVIADVISDIQNHGYRNIIVVDDGSQDNTYEKIKNIDGIIALRHKINRGKGAAAKTGFEMSKKLNSDIVVTIDGDGQHNPKDIKNMIKKINEGFEVILGSRLINPKGMPAYKIIANYLGNFFTWIIYGLWVTDSQSGFRAYSKKAIDLINTQTDRYEYDSEIIKEIYRNKLKYVEIPIEVRYTNYSMNKLHKQNFSNGIKTLFKMLISS